MSPVQDPQTLIELADSAPIAQGAVRDVWDRPGHPGQLLKTIKEYKREKYLSRRGLRRVFDDLQLGPYRTFRIEYDCYLKTAFNCVQMSRPIPIAEIGGVVLTDFGLAQICEKVANGNGKLAQTLNDLRKAKALDADLVQRLNEFVENIYSLNVNVPDLRPANVVFCGQRQQFVLIDGFGDKTLLPIRAWIASLNQRQLDARFAAMTVPGFLQWEQAGRVFRLL